MKDDRSVLLVVATGEDPSLWANDLAAAMPDLIVLTDADTYDPASVDFALVWKPPAGLLASLDNLQAIFSLAAGIDHILADPMLPPGPPIVKLVNAAMREQFRDYLIHAVLHHHRLMDVFARQQTDRDWRFQRAPVNARRTIGVLGLGALSGFAAQGLAALGFPVLGWSRSPKHLDGIETFHGPDGLDALLARTDILAAMLPRTKDTIGLLNAERLSKLRVGGFLINFGRGEHLVDADLLALLDAGHLAGATLDVLAPEPPLQNHPFWTHPKIRLTPHVGAEPSPEITTDAVSANIRRMLAGEPPEPIADRARGY
jgi:glyoxylate/hydroxypyruvate reductase A